MRLQKLAGILVLSAGLFACSTVRETRPLAYPGDARSTTEPIAEVLRKRGYQPSCSERAFCKFKYSDLITIHFKVKSDQVVLVVDVAGGKDMSAPDRQKLIDEGMKVGEEIFSEARRVALAQQEEARRARELAQREEGARRARELAQREEEARRARELAAQQPAATTPAPAEQDAAVSPQAQPTAAPTPPPAPAPVALPEITADLKYSDDFGRTAFVFREPEGTACKAAGDNVWSGSRSLEIPFRMEAIRKSYYTFDCTLPSGAVWRKKLEAKDGFVTTVTLRARAPGK